MFDMDRFMGLARHEALPCVSIYSPTHKAGAEAAGDPIWLKRSLQTVEQLISEWEVSGVDTEALLQPARDLLGGNQLTQFGQGTLSLHLSPGVSEVTHWPVEMADGVFVSDRFHLKPVIPAVSGRRRFYVLAISQKKVRLLYCTPFAVEEMALPDVPTSLVDALGKAAPAEGQQFHTGTPAQRGGRRAMYHGHGAGQDDQQHELFQYFRLVSRGIAPLMDGHSPLIFAGVDHHFPIYQEADTYGNLLDEFVPGNADTADPESLQQSAWQLFEPRLRSLIEQQVERYPELAAHGRGTDDMVGVTISARDGIVEVLLGASDEQRWGRVPDGGDGIEERAEPLPGDYDLVDYAAVKTLLHGGAAYVLPSEELPTDSLAAAMLRY